MKLDGLVKHAVAAFLLALVVYVVAYHYVEHRRMRKGPWWVTFTRDSVGAPTLIISQPALAITNVQISFTGAVVETNVNVTRAFTEPFPVPYEIPYGKCIFMDTTFLPGTIVFELFGHEIQLIPRVLTIDKAERPWRSNERISLPPVGTNAMQQVPLTSWILAAA